MSRRRRRRLRTVRKKLRHVPVDNMVSISIPVTHGNSDREIGSAYIPIKNEITSVIEQNKQKETFWQKVKSWIYTE